MGSAEPLLIGRGLGRRLEKGWLWRHVDFELASGDALAVTGPSGVGKTLLLRMLAGLDALDEGEVICLGRPQGAWAMPAYRRAVLYMHQSATLFEGTVEYNLRLPFTLGGRRGELPREQAIALLAPFGRSADFLAQPQSVLSGGERQMVALVRALLLAPHVLLLDECTSAMDPESTARAEALVAGWLTGAPARACVWVSHDPAQRARVAGRALSLGGA